MEIKQVKNSGLQAILVIVEQLNVTWTYLEKIL